MKLSEIIDYIDSIPSSALLIGFIVLGAVIGWFLSNRKDISELWNSWYQSKKRKDELLNMLLNDHERMGAYEENRLHDRAQSFEIQKQLVDAQTNLAEQLKTVSFQISEMQRKTDERFAESEEKNNKRIRAELKDKIMRAYRIYHERQSWNEMEKEALEDLIEEYQKVGGNSFVHKVIVPEMYTWKVHPIGESYEQD